VRIRLSGRKTVFAGVAFLALVIAMIVFLLLPDRSAVQDDGVGSQTQWFDDNTLYLNDTLYGFTHRIETFLFVGTDDREEERDPEETYHGAMADFVMVLVMDHTDDSYGVIQIDRNTMTEIARLNEKDEIIGFEDMQLTMAHWYGSSPEVNAENLIEAVKNLLGELEVIDGYYMIGMHQIPALNDAVDGVEVKIEDPDMTKIDPAFVQGATVKLTGAQAEKFVRARMAVGEGTNEERMRRQSTYLNAFFEKAAARIYDNPKAVQQFWNTVKDIASTDMNGNDVSRIAKMVMDGENKGLLRFDGEVQVNRAWYDGQEHEEFYADPDSVLEILTDLFSLVEVEEEDDEIPDGLDAEDLEAWSEDWDEDDSEEWLEDLSEEWSEDSSEDLADWEDWADDWSEEDWSEEETEDTEEGQRLSDEADESVQKAGRSETAIG